MRMAGELETEVIHIIWRGPLTVQEAAAANTAGDYGVYQIYGAHEVSGPDTLLYIGQADRGTFNGRILHHNSEWGRWNPEEIKIYLGQIAGGKPITNDEWGRLIDKAEAVLIWKIGVPFNSARVKTLSYGEKPIIVVNHERRHRLPECVTTLTEFINADGQLKPFGPSGHAIAPPVPAAGDPDEAE
jgi:hypothetical protein